MAAASRQLIQEDGQIRTERHSSTDEVAAGFLWDLEPGVFRKEIAILKRMVEELGNPANDPDIALILHSL